MTTQLVLDTLEHAILARRQTGVSDLTRLVHHTDARLPVNSVHLHQPAAAVRHRPIGRFGGLCLRQRTLAESQIGIYKTQVIRPEARSHDVEHVEIETLNWVRWFNHERTHESIDDLTPAEVEQARCAAGNVSSRPGRDTTRSVRKPRAVQRDPRTRSSKANSSGDCLELTGS